MYTKLARESFARYWLVPAGCGIAILGGAFPAFGIGFVGVSLASDSPFSLVRLAGFD